MDGDFGDLTKEATIAFAEHQGLIPKPVSPPPIIPPSGEVDARSEATIATLHPQVQQPFRDLLNVINATVKSTGVVGKWISGYRGKKEQNEAVANGASKAPWPHSAHNGGGGKVGFACDIGFFSPSGKYISEGPQYDIAGKISRSMGFHWGADFGDKPHHCKRPPSCDAMGETQFINELIRRVRNGIPVWP